MLRLSRKVEYALLALQSMAVRYERVVSAKEIADEHDIPLEFLAKVLQTLAKLQLIMSQQGVRGGYVLAQEPHTLTVLDIIIAMEGKPAIVDCCEATVDNHCRMIEQCSIKDPMHRVNGAITSALNALTLEQLAQSIRNTSHSPTLHDTQFVQVHIEAT